MCMCVCACAASFANKPAVRKLTEGLVSHRCRSVAESKACECSTCWADRLPAASSRQMGRLWAGGHPARSKVMDSM